MRKKLSKIYISKKAFLVNLLFVFVFLNLWDLFVSKQIFNAMAIGIVIFGPVVFLWFWGKAWSAALVTLISFVEFLLMGVLLLQGVAISGADITVKTIFFTPFLVMAGLNMVWGLGIYSRSKVKLA